MKGKIDSKTICCSCSHKYNTDGNDGEVAIACDCCNGKNYLLPIDFELNYRECTEKRCVYNK